MKTLHEPGPCRQWAERQRETLRLSTHTAADLRADAERRASQEREAQRRETRLAVLRQIDERLKADELDLTGDILDPGGFESDLGLFTRQPIRHG